MKNKFAKIPNIITLTGSVGIIILSVCLYSIPLFIGILGWGLLAFDKLIQIIDDD